MTPKACLAAEFPSSRDEFDEFLSKTQTKETMKTNTKPLVVAGLVALAALLGGAAHAAAPYANATVAGALAPGVYGRIEIGNAPPPPLIYTQPMIIQRAPVYVQQQPLYLHVPPGHAKKWSKHCARYNACNRPVYFVKVQGDDGYERHHGKDKDRGYENDQGNRRDEGHDKGPGKGHGGGHGNGHGKGHDKG
jgi:hypothetical protein